MLKIYRSKFNQFFFAKKDKDWWSLDSHATDIGTYRLCPSYFGYEEEKNAWTEAKEACFDDDVYFDKIVREDNNYHDIKVFIQKFFDVSDDEVAKSLGYYPDIVEFTKEIVDNSKYKEHVYDYAFCQIYREVKYLMDTWSGDRERVKAYVYNTNMILDMVSPVHEMIDVWCDDPHKRILFYDFHGYWSDKKLEAYIDEACEKYKDDKDFDKRYAYVKDKLQQKKIIKIK